MRKIAEALAQVQAVEGEIEALRAEREALRLEAIALDGSGEPDDITRRAALLEAMQRLDGKIPDARYAPGEDRPAIGWRLLRAREHLENVRRERANLVRKLDGLCSLADKWSAHLDDLEGAFETEARVFGLAGFPADTFLTSLRSRRAWLSRVRRDLQSIPILEQRLLEYGEDVMGEYVDKSLLSDEDYAFRQAQWREVAEAAQLRSIELERSQVQRALGR